MNTYEFKTRYNYETVASHKQFQEGDEMASFL